MAHRTIVLKGEGTNEEATASGAITPGDVLELTTASTDTVKRQATANATEEILVAVEDVLQGNGVSDDYSSGDKVQYRIPRRGDRMALQVADGQKVTKGDNVGFDTADGKVKTYASGTLIGVAIETVDMSDSSGADPSSALCSVRIA